jgi:hypothetical protein
VQDDPAGAELAPSTNPALPSLYRVDLDVPDVPYLLNNAATEGISRSFVAFCLDPQDNGDVCLAETAIGSYPASLVAETPASLRKAYRADQGDLIPDPNLLFRYNVMYPPDATEGQFPDFDFVSADRPGYLADATGTTYSGAAVPFNKIGVLEHYLDASRGGTLPWSSLPRISEGKQYKFRFHLSSRQQTNRQSPFWMYAGTVGFSWGQKLELGGAWTVNDPADPTNLMAWEMMPGVGTAVTDGWYNHLMCSPLDRDIRPEFAPSDGIEVRMPVISGMPGPGVNAPSRLRDIGNALFLIDTLNQGVPNADLLERGNYKIDMVEVHEFDLVPD